MQLSRILVPMVTLLFFFLLFYLYTNIPSFPLHSTSRVFDNPNLLLPARRSEAQAGVSLPSRCTGAG